MKRMLAIVEREMRKFFRSPTLMLASMIFPLVQLVVLGNAFGGKVREARVGVVDLDGGTRALQVREALEAVRANLRTFVPVPYTDERRAVEDVRTGQLQGALVIPPQFSHRAYGRHAPSLGLVVDNSDTFMSASLTATFADLTRSLNEPRIQPRIAPGISLEPVELYPFIEYMKYLLPGSITLAMYVSVMIGGGMLYIDDKARGVHEGYLVTPITKTELVLGLNGAGALKAILAGVVITVLGSLISGVDTLFHPAALLALFALIAVTALALNAMMFLFMVRVEDPLVPRAIFGILNTLLFFPSGAIYPIQAFPGWLKAIARVDPFTYAVHGFKALLLKDVGLAAIGTDLLFLALFSAVALAIAVPLFKRTL